MIAVVIWLSSTFVTDYLGPLHGRWRYTILCFYIVNAQGSPCRPFIPFKQAIQEIRPLSRVHPLALHSPPLPQADPAVHCLRRSFNLSVAGKKSSYMSLKAQSRKQE